MNEKQVQRTKQPRQEAEDLRLELERSRAELTEAEAELAREQAAVNAFRMHCRLKLDDLVDQLMELKAEKQALLLELELLRQGIDPAMFPDDDPLCQQTLFADDTGEEEPLLPTPTPRDREAEKRLFRELARRFHPDLATTAFERSYRTTIMAAINSAYTAGDVEALYDLAGRTSPEEADSLAQITDAEVRRLRDAINRVRRLRSKARRQLDVLRQENTARLWQRAQALDEHDEDGWSVIRRELESHIDRRQSEINILRHQIERLQVAGATAPRSG